MYWKKILKKTSAFRNDFNTCMVILQHFEEQTNNRVYLNYRCTSAQPLSPYFVEISVRINASLDCYEICSIYSTLCHTFRVRISFFFLFLSSLVFFFKFFLLIKIFWVFFYLSITFSNLFWVTQSRKKVKICLISCAWF